MSGNKRIEVPKKDASGSNAQLRFAHLMACVRQMDSGEKRIDVIDRSDKNILKAAIQNGSAKSASEILEQMEFNPEYIDEVRKHIDPRTLETLKEMRDLIQQIEDSEDEIEYGTDYNGDRERWSIIFAGVLTILDRIDGDDSYDTYFDQIGNDRILNVNKALTVAQSTDVVFLFTLLRAYMTDFLTMPDTDYKFHTMLKLYRRGYSISYTSGLRNEGMEDSVMITSRRGKILLKFA
jgi:hypothetical protein